MIYLSGLIPETELRHQPRPVGEPFTHSAGSDCRASCIERPTVRDPDPVRDFISNAAPA
jgi:hypothetical protein